jgi:thiamine-monophosphate kinase
MSANNSELHEIGEFGLIDHIRKIVDIRLDDTSLHSNLIKGISDDAAVFRPTPGKVQLFTTDAFVEGIHFDLTFMSYRHLGWKVIVANISDIAAMGGIPRYATMTIALPRKVTTSMVEELYMGAASACREYSCLIVGGDTTASYAGIAISVSIVGEAEEEKIRYRHDAKIGEYICVTGHLGSSIAGLKVLNREKDRYQKADPTIFIPNLEPYKAAIEKHLMPKPRLDFVQLFTEKVRIGALIDISDGLASEVNHICRNSNVGAAIYEHNFPIEAITQRIAAEFSDQPTDYALHGGEEYELLFTISDAEYEKLSRITNDVTIVGRITERDIVLVQENGEQVPLLFSGYDHFRKQNQ